MTDESRVDRTLRITKSDDEHQKVVEIEKPKVEMFNEAVEQYINEGCELIRGAKSFVIVAYKSGDSTNEDGTVCIHLQINNEDIDKMFWGSLQLTEKITKLRRGVNKKNKNDGGGSDKKYKNSKE